LQSIKNVTADEDIEKIYDTLDKNEKFASESPQVSRTPTDLKFRSTGSKFNPSQLLRDNPDSDSSSDTERHRKQELADLDDEDDMNPRNFFSNMYQNDGFLQLKSNIENDIIQQTKQEVERKHMILDCDRILQELKADREKREHEQRDKIDKLKEQKMDANDRN
jgi:hypothetical protein